MLGPGQDGRTIQPEGIRASALSAAQQTMLLELVREWAGIMNDAFAEPRMAEIQANLPQNLFRVERPDDQRQRRVFPHPGADARHRIRAAGQRRSHPHHLSRSDQRLRCEVRAQVSAAALLLVAAMAVASSAGVSAHRRDEYLQAARIAIEPDRVQIELDLTPGIAVADDVIRQIDADGNGTLSPEEQQAYVRRVLGDLALRVDDGPPLELKSAVSTFADVGALRDGVASVTIRSEARVRLLTAGPHRLFFSNHHAAAASVYLANALVPESDHVAVTGQERDGDQRELTIDFVVGGTPAAPSRRWIWMSLVGALVLVVPLMRRASPTPLIRACSQRSLNR